MKRCLIVVLGVSLLLMPGSGWTSGTGAQQDTSPPPATSGSDQNAVQPYPPQPTYGQSRASRRSYARETRSHRHHRITKGEIAFMAAIAGTSMGIGALAGGGRGLAIGAIVGGWGAYLGHRLWKWIR